METTTATLQDKMEAVLEALREAQAAADEIDWVTNGRDDWNLGGHIGRPISNAIITTMSAVQTLAERDYSEI